MNAHIIPDEIKGKNTNLHYQVVLKTKKAADQVFKTACKKMLRPSGWHEVAGFSGAVFMLVNENTQPITNDGKEGDYIKIDIAGPGSSAGDGYDWVKIELIETYTDQENESHCALRVRPTVQPGKEGEENTAHFFKEDATSTFIIKQSGNIVTASYHGRNEVPNTSNTELKDTIRNTAVALGAIAGLSELQWSALIKGFLESEAAI